MSLRTWFRPPRQLIALFLLVTLLPSVLLTVVGWKLFQRDRASEVRQLQEQRDQAATATVSALEAVLTATEQALGDPASAQLLAASHDAVVVTFSSLGVAASPRNRLIYWPVAAAGREAPAEAFRHLEKLEYRKQDSRAAAAWFRARAMSTDPAIRAGALIRLARNLRKLHQPDAALEAYDRAAVTAGAGMDGAPADLIARWARCALLEEAGRSEQLASEARRLWTDLTQGRWQITRAIYDAQIADARRWSGSGAAPNAGIDRERLSAGVDLMWQRWATRVSSQTIRSGQEARLVNGAMVTALWTADHDRMVALIAGPAYAEQHWLGTLTPLLKPQRLRVALQPPDARSSAAPQARRTAAETGLPWTLTIESVDKAPQAVTAGNGQLVWMGGLAVLLILVTAGTYVVARAVTREFAVTRLQSDFVAAVSHEFRTPLTSLRQLTEILIEERIVDDARRLRYYQSLQRQSQRLHRLVENLLDFGRMEAGTSPYRREPVDVAAIVSETIREVQSEVEERGYSVQLSVRPGLDTEVVGDGDALKTAIRNLLDNAVKYSPACHTVWAEVETGPGQVAVHVRDRGLGVPQHEQHEIFKKFVRGSQASSDRIKGTGVGLAMVEHIVTAHGGRVRLESMPGEGSTFTITLPALAGRTLVPWTRRIRRVRT